MNAEFFALAFFPALNPKLLAIDLLLIENRRPRMMFLCVLLGGLTVGLAVGLLDVLVFHVDAISSQKTVSAGVDLGLGLVLLALGALVATGRLHGRRKEPVPARDGRGCEVSLAGIEFTDPHYGRTSGSSSRDGRLNPRGDRGSRTRRLSRSPRWHPRTPSRTPAGRKMRAAPAPPWPARRDFIHLGGCQGRRLKRILLQGHARSDHAGTGPAGQGGVREEPR